MSLTSIHLDMHANTHTLMRGKLQHENILEIHMTERSVLFDWFFWSLRVISFIYSSTQPSVSLN